MKVEHLKMKFYDYAITRLKIYLVGQKGDLQSYRYAVKHNLFICNKNLFPPMTLSKKNNNIKYLV